MKYFILGDSWGVGEWCLKAGFFKPVPDTGIEYHLINLGHTVTNVSAGSAGNFGQLRHTYYTLKEHADYDYIVWFHTESMRDIEEIIIGDPDEGKRYFPDFDICDWNKGLDYIDTENYRYAQMIYDEFRIPFIVIGGQSPVNHSIKQFSFAKHVIVSWLSELLDLKDLPPKSTFFSWSKIQRILAHYQISESRFIKDHIDSLDRAKIIQDLSVISPMFPDNNHPGRECFKQLAEFIVKLDVATGEE